MNRRDALKLIGSSTGAVALGLLPAQQPEVQEDFKLTEFSWDPGYTGAGWDAFLNWMTLKAQPQEPHRQFAGKAVDGQPTFRGNLTAVIGSPKAGKSTVMCMLAQHWNGARDHRVWASGFVPIGVDKEEQVRFAKSLVNREHSLTRGVPGHLNVLLEATVHRGADPATGLWADASWAIADVSIHVGRVSTGRWSADVPEGRPCDGMCITVVSNRWGPAGDRFYVPYQEIRANAMNVHVASWGYNLRWYSQVHQQLEARQNELALKGTV